LPFIETTHIYFNEWQVRNRSASRLIHYLENKNKPLVILEVGCGNGWLSGRLAALKNSTVTGIDINKAELNQARRVFSGMPNLYFAEGDLKSIAFENRFDTVIFAASIQYFPVLDQVIGEALSFLNKTGEIHILDSHFYHFKDLEDAKQRSQLYYRSIGYAEMAAFYFHHSLESLGSFNYKLLFNPFSLKNRVFSKNDPFPWLSISAT
jgi:ubiquinone/menaquinone biosynthesis C-methylase UbiE